jgi:uncharacterized protein YjbI with pentapeptide repeats
VHVDSVVYGGKLNEANLKYAKLKMHVDSVVYGGRLNEANLNYAELIG